MRAFVVLRQHLTNYQELTEKISSLEKQMNRKFKDIHEALNYLMNNNSPAEIGFKQTSKTIEIWSEITLFILCPANMTHLPLPQLLV